MTSSGGMSTRGVEEIFTTISDRCFGIEVRGRNNPEKVPSVASKALKGEKGIRMFRGFNTL